MRIGMWTALRALCVASALLVGGGHAFADDDDDVRFDSIAVDDQAGVRPGGAGYGVGAGEAAEQARHAAMRACVKGGNDDCKVVLTYRSCGAYASSRNYYGAGMGDSEHEARESALRLCAHDGCRVVVSDCVGQPDD